MGYEGPDAKAREYSTAQINAGDTALLIVAGKVVLHSLIVNQIAASGTVALHDAATIATADTSNEVAVVDVTALRAPEYDAIYELGIVAKPALGDTQGDISLTFRGA